MTFEPEKQTKEHVEKSAFKNVAKSMELDRVPDKHQTDQQDTETRLSMELAPDGQVTVQ